MKQKINKIGMALLIITIVLFNLIIGGNEKTLPEIPLAILTGLSLVVLLIKKIKYKEKLIKSKIDILVLIFMLTLALPLIFHTYATYQGTVEFILKYFFVYTMYLLARNIIDTQKKIDTLVVTTIFSSLIIIVFGFDMLYGNNLSWLLEKLDLKYDPNYRFSSTFGYANAVSIYLTFCVFLAINRIENIKKIALKIIYIIYIILSSYVIYISYSRLVLLLYVLALLSYIGVKVYNKIKTNKKIIKNIKRTLLSILVIFTIYLAVAINYSKPNEVTSSWKFKRKFEPNKEYTISLNIDVIDSDEKNSNIQLKLKEVNKYFTETELAKQKIINGNQTVEFKITPSEDIYYIKLTTLNQNEAKIIVNNCYINGEEHIFSFKYIPKIISRLITSFAITDDSIVTRKYFYENCLRIAADSPIIGHGGNAWKRLSLAYEDYPYSVKETHSYFFELLISYGIVGVIAFLSIIIILFKDTIKDLLKNKEKRKTKLSIFIGFIIFILYSLTFDFSMSFILTILMVFEFIAILQFENEKQVSSKNKYFKLVDWIAITVIGLVFVTLVRGGIARNLIKDNKIGSELAPYISDYRRRYVEENKKNIKDIKEFILKEPYIAQNYMYRLYWDSIYYNYKTLDEKELIDYIDFGIDRFKKIKLVSPMYFGTVTERAQVMAEAVKKLSELNNEKLKSKVEELKEIIIEEYNKNVINMKDLKRNGKEESVIDNFIKNYNTILQSIDIKID